MTVDDSLRAAPPGTLIRPLSRPPSPAGRRPFHPLGALLTPAPYNASVSTGPLPAADRRIAIALFVLALTTYGWFFGGGGWNQNAQFALTRAIVERATFAIDPFAASTGDLSFHGGHVYANKAPGTSFLAAVPYFLLVQIERRAGVEISDPFTLILNSYLCTLFVCGILGALIPSILYVFARLHLDAPRFWCVTIALVIALGTPLFPFSTVMFAHVPSASLLFLSFCLSRGKRPFLAGLAAGAAGLINYLLIPLALLTMLPMIRRRSGRLSDGALALTGVLLPLLLLAYYQWSAFGSPFRSSIATMDPRFTVRQAWFGIFNLPSPEAAWGITFSPYRGLFYLSPVLLLAFAGIRVMVRERRILEALVILSVFLFLFVFNVSFNGWEGGFSIGPRYLIPAIPFLGVALLHSRGVWKSVFSATAVVSLLFNFAAAAVDPQPSGTIPRPMTQYILPLLLTGHFPASVPITPPWSAATIRGHVSVNPVTPDEALPFSRYAAGSGPSLWASFNLGEPIFGVGSGASVLPIAVLILAASAFLLKAARRLDRAEGDRA
jgi:hypothetical protein